MQTYQQKPLFISEAIVNPEQLAETIYQAELWPNNASLSWIWKDKIKVFIVIEIESATESQSAKEIINKLPFSLECQNQIVESLSNLPNFSFINKKSTEIKSSHSEVIGLLGNNWGKNSYTLIKSLKDLMLKRPSSGCYLASQQLGGATSIIKKSASSFVHRNSIWKPWVTGSWLAGDINQRAKSLLWMEEAWQTLEFVCPGIHLAQMHQHLPWHEKELKLAFLDWLPELQKLKSKYDPQGLLPPL